MRQMNEIPSIQWFPGHMTKTKRMMEKCLPLVDAVVEVIDARVPMSSRNPDINVLTAGKPRIIVMNKCDAADEKVTSQWIDYFRRQGIMAIAADCRTGKGLNRFVPAVREVLADLIAKNTAKGMAGKVLHLMVVGIPNVGKSTILSKISSAKPKIANYHFTTLTPNLGVVKYYDDNFVCADIPGLIEGASEGTGLGTEFLRHIERTRVLVHVVDISGSEGRDPYEDYKKINVELRKYSKELAKRPQIVLLNKCDVYGAEENIKAFKKKLNYRREVFLVTAVTGEGLKEVVKRIVEILSELPAPNPIEFEEFSYEKDDPRKFTVTYDAEDNVYAIEGPIVKLLERNVVLDDMDSIAYMQKTLRRYGVIDALRKKGAKDGDTVLIGDIAFDYID